MRSPLTRKVNEEFFDKESKCGVFFDIESKCGVNAE